MLYISALSITTSLTMQTRITKGFVTDVIDMQRKTKLFWGKALEQVPVTSVLNIYVKAPAILTDNGSQLTL